MNPPAPCVILDSPQLAENIGAVARVMANFGLSDLRLVRPRDGWPQERAWASASGADWPLDEARVFERLEDAIADLTLVLATTARPREAPLPVITPREAAARLRERSTPAAPSGCCSAASARGWRPTTSPCARPSSPSRWTPRFHSLNLAQAVAINAYEWRLTATTPRRRDSATREPPADQAAGHRPLRTARVASSTPPASSIRRRSGPRWCATCASRSAAPGFTDRRCAPSAAWSPRLARGRGRVLAKLAAKSWTIPPT